MATASQHARAPWRIEAPKPVIMGESLDGYIARVAAANHLGSLLTRPANRPRGRASDQQLSALVEKIAAWRRATYRAITLGETVPAAAADEPEALTDLQQEVLAVAKRLRRAGLQPGEP